MLPELGSDDADGGRIVCGRCRPPVRRDLGDHTGQGLRSSVPSPLSVEDVHWADAATRDLLAIARSPALGARLTCSSSQPSAAVRFPATHPLRTWLAEQRRFPNVTSLVLQGLSRRRGDRSRRRRSVLGRAPDDDTGPGPHGANRWQPVLSPTSSLIAHRDGIESLPSSLVEFLTSRIERLAEERADGAASGSGRRRRRSATPCSQRCCPSCPSTRMVRNLFDASDPRAERILRTRSGTPCFALRFSTTSCRSNPRSLAPPRRGSDRRRPSDAERRRATWPTSHCTGGTPTIPERSLVDRGPRPPRPPPLSRRMRRRPRWQCRRFARGQRWTRPEERTGHRRDQLVLLAAEWLASCYRSVRGGGPRSLGALAGWAKESPCRAGERSSWPRLAPTMFHLGRPTRGGRAAHRGESASSATRSRPEAAQVHHRVSKQAIADGQIRPCAPGGRAGHRDRRHPRDRGSCWWKR